MNLLEIPIIYLTTPNRPDRYTQLHNELIRLGFKTIIRQIGYTSSKVSVNRNTAAGHYKCHTLTPLPYIILEDDCLSTEWFTSALNPPSEADCVYLGVSRASSDVNGFYDDGFHVVATKEISGAFYRIYNMLSQHAILFLTEKARKTAMESHLRSYMFNCIADTYVSKLLPSLNAYCVEYPLFYQDPKVGGADTHFKFEVENATPEKIALWHEIANKFSKVPIPVNLNFNEIN